jgi:hypothetical protein
MTPAEFLATIIVPAASLLPSQYDTREARCLLLAIAGQESGWDQRLPEPGSPLSKGRGYWRCTKIGAVLAVLTRDVTQPLIIHVCAVRKLWPGRDHVHAAIGVDDELACCVARLALSLDGRALPAIGERYLAWALYRDVWRSSTTKLETWEERYEAAAALFADAVPGRRSAPA